MAANGRLRSHKVLPPGSGAAGTWGSQPNDRHGPAAMGAGPAAGRVRLMRMVAVVLGGGVGQRLGAGLPKQLLTLGGTTLIERCVAAFEAAPGVDEILVVMARGYTGQVEALLGSRYRKVAAVIEGGLTRPESTRVALSAIASGQHGDALLPPGGTTPPSPPEDPGVLLHDAARPLVDQRIIADCVAALAEHDAAGVAVPASDTMVVTADGVMR